MSTVGLWTVTLELECQALVVTEVAGARIPRTERSCPSTVWASASSSNCEAARQETMRDLRYRGWALGRHAETRCPEHASPLPLCPGCATPTPDVYLRQAPWHNDDAEGKPERLCPSCADHARDATFAYLDAKRTAAEHATAERTVQAASLRTEQLQRSQA